MLLQIDGSFRYTAAFNDCLDHRLMLRLSIAQVHLPEERFAQSGIELHDAIKNAVGFRCVARHESDFPQAEKGMDICRI